MLSYNPYGREGAGAPLRDFEGKLHAERVGFFADSRTIVPERDHLA